MRISLWETRLARVAWGAGQDEVMARLYIDLPQEGR
jgi:hypothetical protein